jgi:signal transduction histidine kinase
MGLIWLLQIFFVNHYYVDMKIDNTTEITKDLVAAYKSGNQDKFVKLADDVTTDNDVFVRIDEKNKTVYPTKPDFSYPGEIKEAKDALDSQVKKNGTKIYTEIKSNDTQQARTYVYATYLDDANTTAMYVIAPLYPIKSTLDILQNQLLYIFLIALALVIIFSLFLTNRVSTPLRELTNSAGRLAEGQYGAPFTTEGNYTEIKELTNALNVASSELEKTATLQKDLMANVSHDLRTPLTMIKSYAEMIRDLSGDNPEKRNAHIEVIIEEADRLNVLVNDVMALSAMQAETTSLNISTFDMKSTVESIVATYAPLESEEGYSFEVNCRDHYIVEGDEDKIKQVIANLFTNAIKYCGEDKKIIVNVKRWARKIHLEIIDHGEGIKPEELEHIWERYYKTSTNHVRSTTGSGLGLSIVNEILTLHKARFGAESKVGVGTTFWFELDLASDYDVESLKEKEAAKRRSHIIKSLRHTPKKEE